MDKEMSDYERNDLYRYITGKQKGLDPNAPWPSDTLVSVCQHGPRYYFEAMTWNEEKGWYEHDVEYAVDADTIIQMAEEVLGYLAGQDKKVVGFHIGYQREGYYLNIFPPEPRLPAMSWTSLGESLRQVAIITYGWIKEDQSGND